MQFIIRPCCTRLDLREWCNLAISGVGSLILTGLTIFLSSLDSWILGVDAPTDCSNTETKFLSPLTTGDSTCNIFNNWRVGSSIHLYLALTFLICDLQCVAVDKTEFPIHNQVLLLAFALEHCARVYMRFYTIFHHGALAGTSFTNCSINFVRTSQTIQTKPLGL